MSEEAAVFTRRNELDDPFPIVPDDEPAAESAAEPRDAAPESAPAVNDDVAADNSDDPGDRITDPAVTALLGGDSQHFLQALIGLVARSMQNAAGDAASLGLVLAGLGQALAEGQDEEEVLQDLVDAFERRRLGEAQLHAAAPFIGLLVARIAAAPHRDEPTPDLAGAERLVHAAEEVAGVGLRSGGIRAWRRLPDIAATIAERAGQRRLPIADLAEALPRLATRFGFAPREPVMRVVSNSGQPRGDLPRGETAERPRRMLISGPVEIVILDR